MKKEIGFLATENSNIHPPKTIKIEFPDFAHTSCDKKFTRLSKYNLNY